MSLSRQKRRTSENLGFTLIELLVVVLIIGILASIAIPQYFKVVEKGKLVEAKSWLTNVRNAEERWYNAQGSYEPDFTELDIVFAGGGTGLKYYGAPAVVVGLACGAEDAFTVALTRLSGKGVTAPKRYGTYTVTFTSCTGLFTYTGCTDATACDDFKT